MSNMLKKMFELANSCNILKDTTTDVDRLAARAISQLGAKIMEEANNTRLVREACDINTLSAELLCDYNVWDMTLSDLTILLAKKACELFPFCNERLIWKKIDDVFFGTSHTKICEFSNSDYENLVLTTFAFFATLPEEDLKEYLACVIYC